jgi:exodeoxyribonuclease (lambda-induced)
MIITNYEQGSPDWHHSRLGIPTASNFKHLMAHSEDKWRVLRKSGTTVKLFTNKEAALKFAIDKYDVRYEPGKPLQGFNDYALEIACQKLTNCFDDSEGFSTYWMARGHELEPLARKYYEFESGQKVDECGLILTDDQNCGASVDGLVGDDGIVEIKCLKRINHVRIVLDGEVPREYIPQIQGQLMITERAWCDFVAFHPEAPIDGFIIRVERDEAFINGIRLHLSRFHDEVNRYIKKLEIRAQ